MGTVYAGEHVEIGKGVAIKILHPAYSTQQDLVERFRREARAASRIGHPHIIDVTDFGDDRGRLRLLRDGAPRRDRSRRRAVARAAARPERACQIAIQICRALAAAHAAGVIHRDLKPENIFLVARDGQADFVKVLDFGIARSMGRARRLTNPGVAMGTPEYMAPEQAEGGAVDQRSDIYSVGALIYEMTSGSPPQMSRDKELIPPRGIKADVPEELDRIVVRALAADPARPLPEHGAARVRPGEVALRPAARGGGDAGPARPGARRRAGDLVHRRGAGRRAHPRPESLLASPRRPTPATCRRRLAWQGERESAREKAPTPARAPTPAGAEPRAASTSGGGWRYAGAFVALALLAVAAVTIYPRLPWSARAQPVAVAPAPAAAVPSEAELRAQRLRAGVAEAERMLGGVFGFAAAAGAAGAARAPARRRRRRDRRHAGDARQGAPGQERGGGARSRRPRRRRGALPGGAGARRARGRRGRAGGGAAHARAVGADGEQGHRGGALGARGGGARRRRSGGARPPGRVPARAARGRRGGDRVREGAVGAARRPDLHPRSVDGAARAGRRDGRRQARARAARAARGGRGVSVGGGGARRGRHAAAVEASRRAPTTSQPADDKPPVHGADASQTTAPRSRRRHRRPSRLPTSSSSCIASARSPSIFSRPSTSGCMGGMAPLLSPSNVAPSSRTVVRGRPALTPALPNPTSSAKRRRRRPSISTRTRP